MSRGNLGVDFQYLIVSENDKRFGLTVNSVGFQTIQLDSIYPLKEHPKGYYFHAAKGRIINEYQFVYITEGSGILQLKSGTSIPIEKGQVIVIFPGQWHSYYPTKETGWKEYYIGFRGEIMDELVRNLFLLKQNHLIDVGLNKELVSLYQRAIEIARADKIATQQHLMGIVMHMIGLIISESKNKKLNDFFAVQIIEQAKILINENIFEIILPEELSKRLNMNYTSFRKFFKKMTGLAPAKYIQLLKIQKAKQLLLESNLSIKEISFQLKFYSPENFNVIFRKHTGEKPSKYRSISRDV